MTDQRPTVLDTPEQLTLFHLLQIKYSLKVEINTGLRHSRGSVMNLASRVLMDAGEVNRPFRTKRKAMEAMDRYIAKKEKEMGILDDPA